MRLKSIIYTVLGIMQGKYMGGMGGQEVLEVIIDFCLPQYLNKSFLKIKFHVIIYLTCCLFEKDKII